MTVPSSGNFNMFGPTNGDNPKSVQGAIHEGNPGSVTGDTQFSQLVAASTPSLFYPTGIYTNVNQVSSSCQYRGYPHKVTASSLKYSTSRFAVCNNSSGTYYINTSSSTRFDLATLIWSNSAGTNLATAGWYSNGTIRKNWNGSAFTGTENCSGGTVTRYLYYISSQGLTSGAGYPPSSFQNTWCGGSGLLLNTPVYNESNSNVAGTTDKIFYTSATGTGKFNGTGGTTNYFCISTISGQNTKTIVSKQYTQINSTGDGLDAGIWACNGGIFPY